MILSPNCCAVTVFEYSTTEVTVVRSEQTRSFVKQITECSSRPRKTSEEEEKCVVTAIPR